jgi:DNA-binding MarR family transcriptional regulator
MMKPNVDDVNYIALPVQWAVPKRLEPEACRAWQLLMRFYFVQRRHLPDWAAQFGLSHVQCHVLHLIEPGHPVPMSRLAEVLSCDASNVTGLVDRLEARGLLERRPSPGDRRVKVLDLTPTGARLRNEMLRYMTGQPLPLSGLTPEERRALVKVLERLVGEDDR